MQDFFKSTVPEGDELHDRAANPCYDEHWLAADPAHPKRAKLSRRMRRLGMFDVARGR